MESAKPGKTRAFIAIDLPEAIRESINSLRGELAIRGMRPVSKENMHITIFFLGAANQSKLDDVKGVLQELDQIRFYVSINGIGALPKMRPHIIFAKLGEGTDQILEIYGTVLKGITGLGIRADDRPYIPHITIARVPHITRKSKIEEFLKNSSEIRFGRFLCDSIKLKQSVIMDSGPIYTDLYSKHLG